MVAIRADHLDAAEEMLKEAVRANPADEQAWFLLAGVVKEVHQSLACLQKVLELNPHNEQARQWLALMQEETTSHGIGELPPTEAELAIPRLGTVLLERHLITREQLQSALDAQDAAAAAGEHQKIGEILVQQGAITREQLSCALVALDRLRQVASPVPRLGSYLLDHHFITAEQLQAALEAQDSAAQAGHPQKIGEILVQLGALTREQLEHALREQHRDYNSLFQD
jgi:tetratricopeptide (TPR) repeat protein